MKLKNNRKSQGLPLSTIIVFIIVIITLVVIVVWFVGKFNETGRNVDESTGGFISCRSDNPNLEEYSEVVECKKGGTGGKGCLIDDKGNDDPSDDKVSCANGYKRIPIPVEDGICCGKK